MPEASQTALDPEPATAIPARSGWCLPPIQQEAPRAALKRKGAMIIDAYMVEQIVVGRILYTRLEFIQDMLAEGFGRQDIDWMMFCADQRMDREGGAEWIMTYVEWKASEGEEPAVVPFEVWGKQYAAPNVLGPKPKRGK